MHTEQAQCAAMKTVLAFAAFALLTVAAHAQAPFASDLQLPSKIAFTPRGHLLVAENGTGPNAGRISIVDRNTGARRTLIGGLPAGINSAEGDPAPSGPSGIALAGNTLYVLIAEGDEVLAGPIAGTQIPNQNPSSPLLSSILRFTFFGPIDAVTGNFLLTPADQANLKAGKEFRLDIGNGANQVFVKLLADFENYRAAPRPDFPANVQHSDPYGLAIANGFAYVADAGQNAIRKVDLATGTITTLTDFPPVPNTTGIGGPVIEAVPDSIRLDGNRLLVTLLSGFPFAPGLSKVVAVDPSTGATTTVIYNLTTAIDAVPVNGAASNPYVVSEFSTDLRTSAPGRILLVDGATRTTLAASIVSPASIAVDPRTGDIFAAQIFPGTITHLNAAASLPEPTPSSIIPVVTSSAGAFGSRFETSLQLSNPYAYTVAGVMNVIGATSTKTLPYQLEAFESKTYPSLMTAAGATGAATLDIDAAVGPSPVAIVRIYDTSRSAGSGGTIIKQLTPDDALRTGERSVLVSAADPSVARTNIGTRPLGAGATLLFTLYRADGSIASTTRRSFAANRLEQESLDSLFGVPAGRSDTITIDVQAGSAISYAAIVNNVTQETSWFRSLKAAE
jgi:hypothetical protein